MAYTKQTWVDRAVQYARRFTKVDDGTYLTLTPAPGTITASGTPFDASRLNHMEDGIEAAHDAVANLDLSPYATKDSPTFTGIMGATAEQSVSGILSEKVGADSFTGTSKTITDAFITANTFVSIIPIGTPVGVWTVNSTAGSFTITSTKTESAVAFKWQALK